MLRTPQSASSSSRVLRIRRRPRPVKNPFLTETHVLILSPSRPLERTQDRDLAYSHPILTIMDERQFFPCQFETLDHVIVLAVTM